MLSQRLSLKLDSLTTLQRKLLLELIQRRHPQFWSKFTSHKYNWQSHKESLEEFIQNHPSEFVKELAKAHLDNNGWKTLRGARHMSKGEHCKNPWNGKCRNTDIEVFILYKGCRLPICRRCWTGIANSNMEWGEPLNVRE